MLSKLTIKPLLWAVGLLLVLSAALSVTVAVQRTLHAAAISELQSKVDRAEREANGLRGQLDAAKGTNRNNAKTIAELAERLDAAITEAERLDELLAEAADTLHTTRAARDRALAQLTTQREQVYASDPSCAAWAAGPVCAAVSGSLFELWGSAARPAGPD